MIETRAAFFKDFGVDASIGGETVRGLFDSTPGDAFGLVSAPRRSFQAASDDLAAVTIGAAVIHGGVTYSVAEIQPDGTGVTTLVLK